MLNDVNHRRSSGDARVRDKIAKYSSSPVYVTLRQEEVGFPYDVLLCIPFLYQQEESSCEQSGRQTGDLQEDALMLAHGSS